MNGRTAAVGAALAVSVAATAGPAAAAGAAASRHERDVRAIVSVAPGTQLPLNVPGGRVVTVMRHLGAELVSAPPSALRSLATDSRVVGVTPDRGGRVSGADTADAYDGNGVLAARALGGRAGVAGTGAGVNVALLDTGVSDTPALNRASGRITDGVDLSDITRPGGVAHTDTPIADGYGHGTFLASLIAGGRVPGSHGRALGVAPSARIVVVKVADDLGQTSLAQVLAGMDYVASHAKYINVVNLALAMDPPVAGTYGPDPLTAAVDHVRAAGVVVVAAAGNKAGELGDPGFDPQALTVGAADVSGRPSVASFSGSGTVAGISKPDVVAPGVHVLGMINDDSAIAAGHPEGRAAHGLFKGSGTSEATAITSGVVAAYLSEHPSASVPEVKAALRSDAQPLRDSRAGAGLVRMVDGAPASASDAAANEDYNTHDWDAATWKSLPGWQDHLDAMWSEAVSWGAVSWSAVSWSAVSWSAVSWSAVSWSAVSWSAVSWSAVSWSDYGWGDA